MARFNYNPLSSIILQRSFFNALNRFKIAHIFYLSFQYLHIITFILLNSLFFTNLNKSSLFSKIM